MNAALRFHLPSFPRRLAARAPWGVVGMAVVVLAVELLVVRGHPACIGSVAASWRYKGRHVGRATTREVLCFGDSMVQFGVVPRVIEARTGRPAYNLAVHSGSAPSSYVLLRRALDAGARPSAIVVDFAWEILQEGPASTMRPFPWAELLTPREAAVLAWSARDPGLLASILTRQALPSLRGRHEIRDLIAAGLEGTPSRQALAVRVQQQNWDRNLGAQVLAVGSPFTDEPALPSAPGPASPTTAWRCDPVNAAYLRDFLELARAREIPVYWVVPPASPGHQANLDRRGAQAAYFAFVRAQAARFANVVVVDGRRSGYETTAFHDPVHLNRDGAAAFSLALADLITQHHPAPTDGPRWVALPAFTAPPSGLSLEDTNQSGIAIMQPGAKIRR